MIKHALFLSLACMSLGACSTIVNGQNQRVRVNTGPVSDAECVAIGGSKGKVAETFLTPADVKFPRSSKTIDIRCDKTGYQTATQTISGKVEGTTAGNLAVGGPIGLGVDALTGAIYRYPDIVSIPMTRLKSNPDTDADAPIAGSGNDTQS
jgi:hypothetical protein